MTNSLIRSPMLMKTFFRGECEIDENITYFKNLMKNGSVFPQGSISADSASRKYASVINDPQKLYTGNSRFALASCTRKCSGNGAKTVSGN